MEITSHHSESNKLSGQRSKSLAAIIAVAVVLTIGSITFGIARYGIESSRPDSEQLPLLADKAEADGNMLLALALRKQYAEKFPADTKARILYITAIARNGQIDTAATELVKLGKSREIRSLLLGEANMLYDKSDFEIASMLYGFYIKNFDSSNIAVRIDYGYSLFHSGRREEGKAMTKSVFNIAPNQPLALFNLGVMAAEENNLSESKAMFEQCAKAAEQQYPEVAAKSREILQRIEKLNNKNN